MNNYALLVDLLPVLKEHGIDIQAVEVGKPMTGLRRDPRRVRIIIEGALQ